MKEFFLESRGIYYRTNDFIEGRPAVLFVHGIGGSSSAWYRHETTYKNKYNVVTFDIRGHGKSKRYKELSDYAIEKFVEDMYELINHLKIKKCIIVSHSLGTFYALDFILKHQYMLEGAIFLAPNFNVNKGWARYILNPIIAVLGAIGLDGSYIKGKHIDYSVQYSNTSDFDIIRSVDEFFKVGMKPYLSCISNICDFKRTEQLDSIEIPILIIHGKKDTVFSVNNSLQIQGKIKNLDLVILENSDHILVTMNFDRVSEEIENFVEKVSKMQITLH